MLDTCQDPAQLASLRHLTLGGEVLNPTMLAQARRMMPQAALFNVYGKCNSCGKPATLAHLSDDTYVCRDGIAAWKVLETLMLCRANGGIGARYCLPILRVQRQQQYAHRQVQHFSWHRPGIQRCACIEGSGLHSTALLGLS